MAARIATPRDNDWVGTTEWIGDFQPALLPSEGGHVETVQSKTTQAVENITGQCVGSRHANWTKEGLAVLRGFFGQKH